MTQRVFILGLLLTVMFGITYLEHYHVMGGFTPTLVLGFLLLASYSMGFILEKVRLPGITAYIIVGLVFGPYFFNLISIRNIEELSFINSLALAFIAFCAGGELKAGNIRKRLKSIVYLVINETIIVFAGVSTVVFFLLETIPVFSNLEFSQRLAVSLIFGVISVARSPSSTIAIISETKAKGGYTDIVLSTTVVIDVIVIILFGLTVSISHAFITKQSAIDWFFVLILVFEIFIAGVLGFILGKGIVYLIEKVKVEFPIVIIGIGFLVIKFSHLLTSYLQEIHNIGINLEPLLICMAAGYTVQNYSNYGKRFLLKMDSVSLPIYIVFFTIAGSSINIAVLQKSWIFGIIIVFVRLAMLYIAAVFSGVISRDKPINYHNYWLGFITQAGVSLGLLTEIVRRFPNIGVTIQSLLIATITINQLLGPIAFKYALYKVGDAKRKS